MPRPVCISCYRELTLTKSGVVVQFNAKSVGGPYEQWRADTAECLNCGYRIAYRYADQPSWRHHENEEKREKPDYVIDEDR